MKTTATPMTPLNGFYFHFFGVKSSFSIFCLYIFFLRWVGRTAFANMVNEMMNTTTTDTNCRAIHQLLTINVKRRAIHWNRTIRTSASVYSLRDNNERKCCTFVIRHGALAMKFTYAFFGCHQIWVRRRTGPNQMNMTTNNNKHCAHRMKRHDDGFSYLLPRTHSKLIT